MRLSQYVDHYLQGNVRRIRDGRKPITPSTYLAYQLKGKAKTYSGGYERALMRAIKLRNAMAVNSACNSTAYIPREEDQS